MAGAVHDPQLGIAVGVDQNPGIEHGHEVVVAAVDHQQRTGGDPGSARDGSHLAELSGPGLDIGFFSLAIYLAYVAFLPDEVADRIVGRFDKRALEPGPAGGVGGRASGGAPHLGDDPAPPVVAPQ